MSDNVIKTYTFLTDKNDQSFMLYNNEIVQILLLILINSLVNKLNL
jgi:hypothetical protein